MKTFQAICTDDNGKTWYEKEVKHIKQFELMGFIFVIHRPTQTVVAGVVKVKPRHNRWDVSELSSGACAVRGKCTVKETMEYAKQFLGEKGKENIQKAINNFITKIKGKVIL
jgi:hypothetical protein